MNGKINKDRCEVVKKCANKVSQTTCGGGTIKENEKNVNRLEKKREGDTMSDKAIKKQWNEASKFYGKVMKRQGK